jgi:ribonuclease Z
LEATYRTAHHGEELMPPEWLPSEAMEFEVPEGDDAIVVYENDGVVVKAFRANHEPVDPAVGYRIEYQGKVIVISGDTVSTSALLSNSQNVDMLIAEAMNKDLVSRMQASYEDAGDEFMARVFHDVQDYHMDISDVAQLAKDANVQQLVLHHLAPRPNNDMQGNIIFKSPVEEIYDGEVIVGQDGMQIIISLP